MKCEFIGVQELSEWLGVKPKTIYNWIADSRIPYIKNKGHRPIFRIAEIEAWLKGGHVDAK